MNRFELLFIKYNVDLRSTWLANDVAMTKNPTGTVVITYCKRLSMQEAVVGVAMMLGVLEMRWQGSQFRFRFPIPSDPLPLKTRARQARRDYRQAMRWASRYLIPERMLKDLESEGREPWELCETECLTPEIVGLRVGVMVPPGFVGTVNIEALARSFA